MEGWIFLQKNKVENGLTKLFWLQILPGLHVIHMKAFGLVFDDIIIFQNDDRVAIFSALKGSEGGKTRSDLLSRH